MTFNIRILFRSILFLILFLSRSTLILAQEDEKTPIIKEIYYADKDGVKITETNREIKRLYLVIITENMRGKVVDIKLAGDELGVICKGSYYKNNSSFKLKIKKEIQKLKLSLYDSNSRRCRRIKARTLRRELKD